MDPIELTEEEQIDAKRREELDAIREEGRNQFEKEVSDRVDKLRDAVKGVKGDLMGPGKAFRTILQTRILISSCRRFNTGFRRYTNDARRERSAGKF